MFSDQLVDEALRLTESDRAALAATLLESLDASEVDVSAGWEAEIRRRLDELDRGEVKTIPWGEARRSIAGEDQ